MRVRSSWIPAAALVFALGRPSPGAGAELDDLETVLRVIPDAAPETQPTLLIAGLDELDRQYGWEGTCGDAFEAYARAPAELRATMIAAAFEGCPAMCPTGAGRDERFAEVGAAPRLERGAALVAACDAGGPDPVFTGELAALRERFSPQDYWVFRAGYVLLRQRLDALGGERAAAIRAGYDELLPSLAARLALHLPPAALRDRLPTIASATRPRQAPELTITADEIALDGRTVCALDDGVLDDALREGPRIVPLSDALPPPAEPPGRLRVLMDRDLSTRVLEAVVFTAGRAGYGEIELAGVEPDEARQTVHRLSLPELGAPLDDDDWSELPPLNLMVLIDDAGIRVIAGGSTIGIGGEPSVLAREDGAYPFDRLHTLLARLHDEYPAERRVFVAAEGDVPYHALTGVLDATHARIHPSTGDRTPMFADAALVGGGDAPPIAPGDRFTGGTIGGETGGGTVRYGIGGLGTRGRLPDGDGYGYGALGPGPSGILTTADEPIILGALAREQIDGVVQRHGNQLRYCYHKALNKQPALAGKLTVKVTIAADGTVSSSKVHRSSLGDTEVEQCVVGRFARMTFPEPRGGGIVILTYPLTFTPDDAGVGR